MIVASEDTGAGKGFAKDRPKGRIRLAEGEEGVQEYLDCGPLLVHMRGGA
jgi:hypothetical protein